MAGNVNQQKNEPNQGEPRYMAAGRQGGVVLETRTSNKAVGMLKTKRCAGRLKRRHVNQNAYGRKVVVRGGGGRWQGRQKTRTAKKPAAEPQNG